MYQAVFSDEFKKQLQKIKKRDPVLYERLTSKVKDIMREPEHLKYLRNVLQGQQRVHLGSFVLRFSQEGEVIYFIAIDHHDKAY